MSSGRHTVYNGFVCWLYMEPAPMPWSKKCHLYSYPRREGKIILKELKAAEHGRMPGFQTKSMLLSVGMTHVLFLLWKPLVSAWILFVINTIRMLHIHSIITLFCRISNYNEMLQMPERRKNNWYAIGFSLLHPLAMAIVLMDSSGPSGVFLGWYIHQFSPAACSCGRVSWRDLMQS